MLVFLYILSIIITFWGNHLKNPNLLILHFFPILQVSNFFDYTPFFFPELNRCSFVFSHLILFLTPFFLGSISDILFHEGHFSSPSLGYLGSVTVKPTSMRSHPFKLFQQKLPFSIHQHSPYPRPSSPNFVSIYFTSTGYIKDAIICDGILHVIVFHYLKTPYIVCTFFAKFIYNEYTEAYFLSHVVSTIFAVPPKTQLFVLILQ